MKSRTSLLLVYSIFTVSMNFQLAYGDTKASEVVKTNQMMDSKIVRDTKGVFVEALYSMLKTEGSNVNNYVVNPTVILNEPIHTVGFGVGYRDLRAANFGFEFGGQLIQESSGIGTSNPAFYQINGSLTYSTSSNFYGFAGPSINYLNVYNDGNYASVKSSPALGGQFGMGYIFKGFYGKVTYQYMQFQSQLEYKRSTGDTVPVGNDFKMSGLVTQIGYNF